MVAVAAFSVGLEMESFRDCSSDSNGELNLKPGMTSEFSMALVSTEDELSTASACSSSSSEAEWETSYESRNKELDYSCAMTGIGSSSKTNAWVPRHRARHETEAEEMKRTVRSILNKLTLEKFNALYEQLATSGLSTPEHMAILMQEVFEKATSQHHFIEMYADLCVRLEADPRLAYARGSEGDAMSFRHLLLSACQSAFLRMLQPQTDPRAEAIQEHAAMRRKIALGNVKLVGHLMVRGMLSSRLLVACSESLLRGHSSCPEALDALAALLTVTGKHFESRKDWQYADRLAAAFASIVKMTKDTNVSARSRFLLRDLLELREAGWPSQARPAVAKERPMLLEDVREQVRLTPQSARTSAWQPSAGSLSQARRTVHPLSRAEVAQCGAQPIGSPAATASIMYEAAGVAPIQAAPSREVRKSGGRVQSFSKGRARQAAVVVAKEECGDRTDRTSETLSTTSIGCRDSSAAADSKTLAQMSRTAQSSSVEGRSGSRFDLRAFRRYLNVILKDLSAHRNVAAAVRCVRVENVPVEHQAREFADLLTRAAEETRGIARKPAFAFIAGLAAGEDSAFDRTQCLTGIRMFFDEIFEDLKEEVPGLHRMVSVEMLATLRTVLSADELKSVLPHDFAE